MRTFSPKRELVRCRNINAVCLVLVLIAASMAVHPAQAQKAKYTTLYSFSKSDGATPESDLIRDSAGNLYGTTYIGGHWNSGTLFKLDTNGSLTTVHEFNPNSGAGPVAGLAHDTAGNLYGTLSGGGSGACVRGCGGIFRIDAATQVFTELYLFAGGPDGATPLGGLVLDHAGNLYGTTRYGGTLDKGTIFKLQPDGTLTILHRFTGFPDGESPFAGLVADSVGNLYGTTRAGGTAFNYGTIFKVDTNGNESVIYRFTGAADGAYPLGSLIVDDAGNFYGTTIGGGGSGGGFGNGVAFKLDASSTLTVLHTFTTPDGLEPSCTLLRDATGNLYGTTYLGGTENQGTVFRLEPSGRFRVLHNFLGGVDRGKPYAGLIRDNAGNLYGTTTRGGTNNFGTVFRISF